MKRVVLLLLVSAVLACALMSTAAAETKFGVRQMSFHNSIYPTDQSLGFYFGLPIGTRMDLIFGADYWSYKISLDVDLSELGTDIDATSEVSGSIGTALIHAGIKMYFAEPMKGEVAAYISGEFFKGFGQVSTEPDIGEFDGEDPLDPLKEFLSPMGFTAAFGAEFFASDNFSVGGEAGLRYVITKLDSGIDLGSITDLLGDGGLKVTATESSDQSELKLTTMTIYTGVTLNFMF